MGFNGPRRALEDVTGRGPALEDVTVYCKECGNVYVRAYGRACPACVLMDRLEEVQDDLRLARERERAPGGADA